MNPPGRWIAALAALLAIAQSASSAQLSLTPSFPQHGESVSVELRDTQWPTYLRATRYMRVGSTIAIDYEYAKEAFVAGRADFGNARVDLGELVSGTYFIEARLVEVEDASAAAQIFSQALVVLDPAAWGIYVVPREPDAFAPTDLLISSAVYFEPGSMQVSVSGSVVRVAFDFRGDAPVGGRKPPGTTALAAARIPSLAPGPYVVEAWGREKSSGIAERYFTRPFIVSARVPVIEYYSEALDQYMMSASAPDIAMLDAGESGSWRRTGQQFKAWLRMGDGPADAKPVCRFRLEGSTSRFHTAAADECAYLKALAIEQRADAAAAGVAFRGWTYENVAFYAMLPENGLCAPGTTAVFRSYNEGGGHNEANHRFIADPLQRAAMAMSWIDEGVAFCSPAG